MRDVDRGGLLADEERFGDLAVGATRRDQSQDVELAGAQPVGSTGLPSARTFGPGPPGEERLDRRPSGSAPSWTAIAPADVKAGDGPSLDRGGPARPPLPA